ncbi:MAG: uroporphyrinogen-III synthase [Angustibacter sp.]
MTTGRAFGGTVTSAPPDVSARSTTSGSTRDGGSSRELPAAELSPTVQQHQANRDPSARAASSPAGVVAFVGTGPGDPGLLTLRAVEVIAAADVVILDRVLGEDVVRRWSRPDAQVLRIDTGGDGTPLTSAAQAKALIKSARGGRRVARLLDGDPVLFSGLAEEAMACRKAQLDLEIVPGVSAVTAVPSYAGIPLTTKATGAIHVFSPREPTAARSVQRPVIDWAASVDSSTTVVVVGSAGMVIEALAELAGAGRDGASHVAITTDGTTTRQSTVTGQLSDVARLLQEAPVDQPVLAVVGEPVGLREQLSWFETKPLFGWRVLVPRTKDQAGATVDQLAAFGAVSDVVPTISVEPPRTPQQMDRAVRGLVTGRYEWVGFTSVNAVRAVRERFEELGLDARAFSGLKVATVGGVTAAALRDWGIEPDLMPASEQSALGLLADWPPYDGVLDPINRVFLPRADIATDTLVAGLTEMGWEVDDVTAYRTVRAAPPPAPVRDAIKAGAYDAVVFTSSSTVRNLIGIAGKPHQATVVACIGPATAKTAQEHGLRVDVLAPEATTACLVEALAQYGSGQRLAAMESGEQVVRPSQRRVSARRRAR